MKSKSARNIFIILLAVLAAGALGGGAVLIINPSGDMIGMPVSMLRNSPFGNFLFPGLILFTVIGLAPALLIIALIRKSENKLAEVLNFFGDMHWSWSFTIYIAFALIIWLQVEMMFLQAVSWLHTFYMLYAVLIIFTALLPAVKNNYKK